MSDDRPLDDFTLEDYNEVIAPNLLRLTKKLDEGGNHTGFILQSTETASNWVEIADNNLYRASLQANAFIRGVEMAYDKFTKEVRAFLAAVQEENEEDVSPDDLAKATACGKWLRKQHGLKFLDEVSAYLAKKSGGGIVEFIDPKTSLVSHAFVDKTGKHEWIIPHEDKFVAALVVKALLGGFREGHVLANFQMHQIEPTKTLEEDGGKLN